MRPSRRWANQPVLYDGNHNLPQTIDPLGYSNQFFYDSQNNLIRSVDPRGNPTTFGYNAQFCLTGSTNGAGDWVSLPTTPTARCTPAPTPAGTTTYGYDYYGQLNSITYPGSLGSESFGNNPLRRRHATTPTAAASSTASNTTRAASSPTPSRRPISP